jgi:hypothetical protein
MSSISNKNISIFFNELGQLHSDNDQPAVIINSKLGTISEWYENGILHRSGDKPAIVFQTGNKYWYFT